MKKSLPPLNWLRTFASAARHLSFTRAALELNLTQAAVSQQIKSLEIKLATPLFKRLPKSLELTEAGLAYLPAVQEAIERLAAATDELFGAQQQKPLSLKVSLVFLLHWLAARLPAFRRLHPDIGLHLTSTIWTEDAPLQTDIEIRHGQGKWPGLKAQRLTWDVLLPVCAPALASAEKPLNSPQDLTQHELLHVLGYEEGWGFWLKKVGASEVDASSGMQFDTLLAALCMAEQGQGVALARSSLVQQMLQEGRLIAPLSQQLATEEAFWLVYSPHSEGLPQVAAFIDWLSAEALAARHK